MINITTLDALQDDELRLVIKQSETLLIKRDEERKAKAIADASAILAAAGLTFKDVPINGRKKAGRGPVYLGGHTYQHPADESLLWNAKGQKPNWLRQLETRGEAAIEITPVAANDNSVPLSKRVG